MANLSISNITNSGCNWQATSLQVLGVATYCKLTEGGGDLGSQTVGINATASGTGYVSLSAGNHYLDCNRYRSDNNVLLGNVATNQLVTIPYSRPSDFSGFVTLRGTSFTTSTKKVPLVSASSWLAFTDRINDFRMYKGLSSVNFTAQSSGNAAPSLIVNTARTAISAMNPPIALPEATVQGGKIDPDYFLKLQNSLNSIT